MMYMGNFVWVWIAAAERTTNMQFITGVMAPIYRYHPVMDVHSTSPDEMKFIREFGKKYCHTFKDGLNS